MFQGREQLALRLFAKSCRAQGALLQKRDAFKNVMR
jgi:hypothetical protein